jgi:hypothetical protein
MGIINAENQLKFRSTIELFNRIKKRLSSFDSQNMIDEGDFYDYIVYVLEALGVSVYKECEAVLEVHNFKTKLPCNFRYWYAGYKAHRESGFVPSINEQKPWIYYQDNEISQVCPEGNCSVNCHKDLGRTKIVIRTFVNGDGFESCFDNPLPLFLSPNVKDKCSPHAERQIRTHFNEVTIDNEGWLHTKFEHDHIYLQYYGLPFDDNMLPMIPDQPSIEKAIEYYIYTMLFEEWYLNSSVPNIGQQLQYVKNEYDHKHFPQASYFVKLPSFQRCLQSLRIMRSRNKFYQFTFDKTKVGSDYYGLSFPRIPIV